MSVAMQVRASILPPVSAGLPSCSHLAVPGNVPAYKAPLLRFLCELIRERTRLL